ncbi:unnamed protein product [Heligmosomoides polygyrus]|uniref:Glucuronosyltransferase n=1 Tax=Heligmosomoides polygyrus TaxID=6339 RepID=A0A183GAQ0_HELPZ|nr:unnamed protein product [Heligmosomoides polygyrus]
MIRSWVVLLLLSICATNSYKFLVYSPIFGYSHTNFMGAIADALTEAGHDVTMLMPIMEVEQENKTGVTLTKKIIKTPPDPRAVEMMRHKDVMMSKMWIMQPSLMGLLQANLTEGVVVSAKDVAVPSKTSLAQLLGYRGDIEPLSLPSNVRPMLYFGDSSLTLRPVTDVADANVVGRFCGGIGDVIDRRTSERIFSIVAQC